MSGLLIGYARLSIEGQDLTAQRDGLAALGVDVECIYVDHGLTGTDRERPGRRQAMAACRAGDTLVVTRLDRLARSLPDARAIAEDLTKSKVRLSLVRSKHGHRRSCQDEPEAASCDDTGRVRAEPWVVPPAARRTQRPSVREPNPPQYTQILPGTDTPNGALRIDTGQAAQVAPSPGRLRRRRVRLRAP